MILLLDTHVVAWLAGEPQKLSRRATQAIERSRKSGSNLAIAGITLFELATQIARRRFAVEMSLDRFLSDVESRFLVLPVNAAIAERAAQMPESFPKDPMDRLIAATAIVEGMLLVTADKRIQESGLVQTIW